MTTPIATRKSAYRFLPGETLAEGFSRIFAGQIRKARRQLANPADHVKSVHEARKALKRIRALLALFRPALGDKTYRKENARYRDVARMLATSRDQAVLRASIASLRQRLINNETSEPSVASPLDLIELDPRLAPHADAGLAALFECMEAGEGGLHDGPVQTNAPHGADAAIAAAYEALSAAARVQPDINTQLTQAIEASANTSLFSAGYRNCYALGRREMRAAFASSDDELFHEWRKAVQLHWRQSILLSTPWPAMMQSRAQTARELSQIIGQDHDLAVLAVHAASQPKSVLSDKRRSAVVKTIAHCQSSLRQEARKIGAVLFAQKPAELQAMMECTWAAACDGEGRLALPHPALCGPAATK